MAGVITRGSLPKLLWEGLNQIFGLSYTTYNSEWKEMFEQNTSEKAYEEDVGLTGMGLAPQKAEGQSIQYDTMKQNYVSRYTNLSYALGYIITREELDDNLYAQFGKERTQNLANSINITREHVGANIFNRAFSGSYTGGDGVSLCNSSHPIEGGTFANQLSVPADLSESSLEQACIDISKLTDARGIKIAVRPQKLIIPTDLMFTAERILKNPAQPDTAERNINALYQMGMVPQGYRVNHYLTDADAWFIITDCPKGLRYFERKAASFEDDNDFDTKNAKYSAYIRYSFGWTDPRGVFASQGA